MSAENLAEIRSFGEQALDAIKDPASNPLAAIVSLAIVVLVLLIAVLIVYLVVSRRGVSHAPHEAISDETLERPRPRHHWWVSLVLGVALLAGVSVGWNYSTRDKACAQCHFTKRSFESRDSGSHQSVPCQDCHVGPGFGSAVATRLRGVRNLRQHLLEGAAEGPLAAPIDSAACLSCHSQDISGVVTARSIRMRHSDVLAVGYSCVECHNTEGHGKSVRRPAYPRMSACLACHDGTTASAGCPTCHSNDVGVAVRRPKRPYAQTNIERDDCRGCHSMESCNACHGLELPHSEQFIEGFHARKAFLQPTMCTKCHDLRQFCNQCHRFPVNEQGVRNWKRVHSNMGDFVVWHSTAPADRMGACSCHTDDRERFCNYCHGPQPER